MKSKNLVICDSEEEYAKALAMFFMKKKGADASGACMQQSQ